MIPAVSQIAWHAADEGLARELLVETGIRNIELAPARIFRDSSKPQREEIALAAAFWNSVGISPVAFQAVMFGKPELQLFHSRDSRLEAIKHLKSVICSAGELSLSSVVLGAPKNRVVPEKMNPKTVEDISIEVFSELAAAASSSGTVLCIEPNPQEYGCNFITNADEGLKIVKLVNSDHFKLHLDTACMWYAKDDAISAIVQSQDDIGHFHLSAPNLGKVPAATISYSESFDALRKVNYKKVVSLEMKANPVLSPNDFLDSINFMKREIGVN